MGASREAMNATTRLRGATRAPTCKWCTRFPVPCTSRICYLRLYPGTARACVDRLRAGGGDGCKRLRSCVRVWWAIAVLDLHTHWLTFFRSLCPPATCGLLQPHLFSTRSPRLVSSSPSCCAIPTFAPPRPQVRDDHQQLRAPAGGVPQLPAEPRASRSRGARSGGGVRRRGGSLLAAQHLAADAQVVHGRRPALRPRERRPFAGGGTSRREEEILMCYMLLCAVCCNA